MFLDFCFVGICILICYIVNTLLRCLDILICKFLFSTTFSDNEFGERSKGQTFPQVSEFESTELCLLLFHGFAPLRRNCLDTHHPAEVCCNPPKPWKFGEGLGKWVSQCSRVPGSPLFFISNSLQHILYTFLHGEAWPVAISCLALIVPKQCREMAGTILKTLFLTLTRVSSQFLILLYKPLFL